MQHSTNIILVYVFTFAFTDLLLFWYAFLSTADTKKISNFWLRNFLFLPLISELVCKLLHDNFYLASMK